MKNTGIVTFTGLHITKNRRTPEKAFAFFHVFHRPYSSSSGSHINKTCASENWNSKIFRKKRRVSSILSNLYLIDSRKHCHSRRTETHVLCHLTGPAAQMLESISASDDNYLVALLLLREKYTNKQHIQALCDLGPVKAGNAESLQTLFDDVRRHCRALEVADEPVRQWNKLLVPKLDAGTVKKWETEVVRNEECSIEKLNKFILDRCRILRATNPRHLPDKRTTSSVKTFSSPKVYNTLTSENLYEEPVCKSCDQRHELRYCVEFCKMNLQGEYAQCESQISISFFFVV